MLGNTSQLVIRNLSALAPGRMLLVNPPADDLPAELSSVQTTSELVLFSQDYSDHRVHERFQDDAIRAVFGPKLENDDRFDQVIVFLARERQRTRMLMEMVSSCTRSDANIWLVGEKRAGIKASSRFLAESCGAVSKLDTARHCMLFSARNDKASSTFSLQAWFESFQVHSGTLDLSVASLPGVFSHMKLDSGTRLLLENLNCPGQGRVLDFGCGCGIIGTCLKLQSPDIDLVLTDSSALALAATRETIQRNGVETGTEVIASDVYSEIDDRFDLIVSNPPFHKGVATHYGATEQFLQQSVGHLHAKGQLVIVANHFLHYAPLLESVFGRVETLAGRSGFKVYRCRRS